MPEWLIIAAGIAVVSVVILGLGAIGLALIRNCGGRSIDQSILGD